jgi:hypothetical protein
VEWDFSPHFFVHETWTSGPWMPCGDVLAMFWQHLGARGNYGKQGPKAVHPSPKCPLTLARFSLLPFMEVAEGKGWRGSGDGHMMGDDLSVDFATNHCPKTPIEQNSVALTA